MPRSSRNPGAGSRARAELARDPARSDAVIAAAAACTSQTVHAARRAMERAGTIPAVPVRDRRPRPRPLPRSRTRAAIAELGTAATPRQVADKAGVSIQAAWRMLRSTRAQQAAAAAAARKPKPKPKTGKPTIPDLPQQPDLSRGQCATAPPDQRGWWTSEDYAERRAAALACQSCGALAECRVWALALPATAAGLTVYGGMLATERHRLRRAAHRA